MARGQKVAMQKGGHAHLPVEWAQGFIFFFFSFFLLFSVLQSYIVYLGAHSHGPEPTSVDLDRVTNSHYVLKEENMMRNI